MRRGWILSVVVLALSCARTSSQAPVVARSDVTLIEVRLVSKIGSGENALADDSPKEVSLTDTVWVYPVLKVAVGASKHETLYLCNTTHVSRVGRDGDTTRAGWSVQRRLDIWNKLKRDIRLDWFEVVPCRESYGSKDGIRYRFKPVVEQGWCLELTGGPGTRRLAIEASYGGQAVRSCNLASEASVACAPWLSVRSDTSVAGWAGSLVGALPYRSGSTPEQTSNRISCDSRGLVLFALSHIGYHFDAYNADAMDSMGEPIFSGFVKLGKLYGADGKPARLRLGQDVRKGDVIHFTSRQSYGIVSEETQVPGWSFGGIPAGLPVIGANSAGPRTRPLHAYLLSLRDFFGKSEFTIRRYPYVPPPPPPKVRNVRPPAAPKPAVAPKVKAKTVSAIPKAVRPKPASPGEKPKGAPAPLSPGSTGKGK